MVHDIFVILNYLSVFVMLGCFSVVSAQESSKMQKLAMAAIMTLTICCTGFLIRIEANTAESLIAGQKLIYATVTHSMFLMLLFICEYCRFDMPKIGRWVFHGLNLLITVVVLTLDHHKLFYKDYWAVHLNGYSVLEKDYGFMHTVAIGLFAIYMAASVILAIVFSVKNMKRRSKYVWRLLIAVSIPCLSYIIPKLTDSDNDFQPIAFALFTVMVLVMVYRDNLYDVSNISAQYSIRSMKDGIIVLDKNHNYMGCNDKALELFPFLGTMNLEKDIRPESDEIREILSMGETELTRDGRIYDISVRDISKSDTSEGKVIWIEDVTIERNYMRLLKEQNENLENEVVSLTDKSYTDEMTGLKNVRSYRETIDSIRKEKDISLYTIAVMDINRLKAANDNIGHAAGDELIKGAAKVIDSVLSGYGTTFRTGGDEFYAVLKGNVDTKEIGEKLNEAAENWSGTLIDTLSISAGFARGIDNMDCDIDSLINLADKEMYRKKDEYYLVNGYTRRS